MKTIRLKDGKERSLLRRHPWVFESAIAKGGGDPGETVRVESHAGQFLGWASFSPSSRIRARIWSFDEAQRIDAAFIASASARVRTPCTPGRSPPGIGSIRGLPPVAQTSLP